MTEPSLQVALARLREALLGGDLIADQRGHYASAGGARGTPAAQVRTLLGQSLSVSEALLNPAAGDVAHGLRRLRATVDELSHAYTQDSVTRLHIGGSSSLLDALQLEFTRCRRASLAVAFLMHSGLRLLEGSVRAALLRGASLRVLTTDYLDTTEPEALEILTRIPGRLDARIYVNPARSFHPKVYWFERHDGSGRAYIGSANLSRAGLLEGVEWTWSVLDFDSGAPMAAISQAFESLFEDPHSLPLTPDFIAAYAARRQPLPYARTQSAALPALTPRPMQQLALRELARLRTDGERRALVVAATGLGKTCLAAFDATDFQRTLFIAHREELLVQAEAAYRAVHPNRSCGLVQGSQRELDRDMVFATIQTLTRPEVLAALSAAQFDHIVVDEFHHAAAESYRRVLEALRPRFLLGLTATPYRADNRDVHALCDDNVAYQVGLFEAIALGWLCPFHYYGVADVVHYDDSLLNNTRSGYDARRLTLRFNTDERAALVLAEHRTHASVAALGFCVSIAHANFMAAYFIRQGVPALSVHSGPDSHDRADAIRQLTSGAVRVLFTVDLFNEGVDIPCVDQVLFLRPTESMTIFVQQLGRGLRLHEAKSVLTVIDFIGNYRRASFKLPFLVGDERIDPDAQRKALRQLTAQNGALALPGVVIHLAPVALATLRQSLDQTTKLRDALIEAWQALRSALGRRPDVLEVDRLARFSARQFVRAFGSWHGVLAVCDRLSETEQALEARCGEFLRYLEKTPLTKSYKMVSLQALLKHREFQTAVGASALCAHFREHFGKERFRPDIDGTAIEQIFDVSDEALLDYLQRNPINALIGGNTEQPSPWFAWSEATRELRYIGPVIEDVAAFAKAVRERIDWRLHEYMKRPGPGSGLYKVLGSGNQLCIMLGKHGPARDRTRTVKINDRYLYGFFKSVALNKLGESDLEAQSSTAFLTTQLRSLFDDLPASVIEGRLVRITRLPGEDCLLIERGD